MSDEKAVMKVDPGTAMAMYKGLSDIQAVAKIAAQSALCGTNDVNKTTVLFLRALADGVNPIYASTRYHIIKDKITLSAEAMLAEYIASGGTVEWKEHTATACEAVFSHPKGSTLPVRWTIEQAKAAGLIKPDGNWIKHPEDMLHARCVSRGVRWTYPLVTQGLYTPEEITDAQGSAPAVTQADKDRAIDTTADTRPKADRLADAVSARMAPPGDVVDAEYTDKPDPAVVRGDMNAQIKAIYDVIGMDELKAILKHHGYKKLADISNEAVAEVLAELQERQKEINSKPAEPTGTPLALELARKHFFAVVTERFGRGFDHHKIVGEGSLNDINPADIEKLCAEIEAGEFDDKKGGA